MIGPKNLRTIRQDLRRALAASGQDPIRRLDECLAAGKQNGIAASSQNEVLHSLQRFLRTPKTSPRERKTGVRKMGESSKAKLKRVGAI